MKYNRTVIVLYGEKTEAFSDLVKFCKVKGINYNTAKQKKFPLKYKGACIEKEIKGEGIECIERNGQLIRIL